jgi:hypothetical protein
MSLNLHYVIFFRYRTKIPISEVTMTPLVSLMTMSSYALAIIFVLENAQNAVQVQLDN